MAAVEYGESKAFCGQVCDSVMKPEFVAHQNGLHARVECVSWHLGPGAGAFLAAKLNGSRQLWLVATGAFRRPIPTPIERVPDVQSTCERCHAPDRFVGDKIKVFYEHADDEANTQTNDDGPPACGWPDLRDGERNRHPLANEPRERRRLGDSG